MPYWRNDYFPPSRPLEATGGIRARSKKGGFAESWWGRRWIEVLSGFGAEGRLQRGRAYARKGQVLSIEVERGRVRALVQGSRARPYKIVMEIVPLPDAAWERVVERIRSDLRFATRLLSGELPPEIEAVLAEVGVPLFPQQRRDLITDCTCPDWSDPCKHIAAVHFLLAEAFDQDPFLVLRLRGLERDELLGRLAEGGATAQPGADPGEVSASLASPPPPAVAEAAEEPLPTDPAAFWGTAELPQARAEALMAPPVSAVLLRRLGDPPFWRDESALLGRLEGVYEAAAVQAMELLGEEGEGRE